MDLFAKIVNDINLKPLTIVAKVFILDAWLGPESAPTGGYNTVTPYSYSIHTIQNGGGVQKVSPSRFFPVTSTNVGVKSI